MYSALLQISIKTEFAAYPKSYKWNLAPSPLPNYTPPGARPGYYFTKGPQGLGYYLDNNPTTTTTTSQLQPIPTPSQPSHSKGLPPRAPTKARRGRTGGQESSIDPMDPSSYSDAPRGSWAVGLEGAQPRAVDTTASGPLF